MYRCVLIVIFCAAVVAAIPAYNWAENPPVPLSIPLTNPQVDLATQVERLASAEFTVRRAAFFELWKAGEEAVPLLSTAKAASQRQVVEAATVLELLIRLRITPETDAESARLLELIIKPTASAVVELCEMKFWNVAERMLRENAELLQKFHEPYGRYLQSRIVELAVAQGDPTLAWPIVGHVTVPPQNVWIAHKAGLELPPAVFSDPNLRALKHFYANEVEAALEIEVPVALRLTILTRSGRWPQLLEERVLLALCGREQTVSHDAVKAVIYEFAGEIEAAQAMWQQLLVSEQGKGIEQSAAAETQAALGILKSIDAGELGVQTAKNQFLAALLFSGRTEPIEQYLKEQDTTAAFGFFLAGNNYRRAFEALGLAADLSDLEQWLARRKAAIMLDFRNRNPDNRQFDEAARLCSILSGIGFQAEARQILEVLVELARLTQRKQEELWSRSILGWLGRSEARAMALQAAQSEFQRMSRDCQGSVLKGLFPEFEDAAQALWSTSPSQAEADKWRDLESLYLLDRRYFGGGYSKLISKWLRSARDYLSSEQLSASHLSALAKLALGFGETELALELLLTDLSISKNDSGSVNTQWIDAARILSSSGKVADALTLFKQVRKSGSGLQKAYTDEMQNLLLSGQFEQAAALEQARWLRPLATTRFYQGYNYLQAMREFVDAKQWEFAAEYAEAAFMLADSGSMDVYWAASEYAGMLAKLNQEPVRRADVLRAGLVEALQPYASSMQYMISNSFYSSLRFAAQKERLSRVVACIVANDLKNLHYHLKVAYGLQPQDIEMVVQCYPLLIEAGRNDIADELFSLYEQGMLEQISAWPRDATGLNNLAWMYARCDRKLDQALELSRQAVGLAPSSAIFLDTLAEIEFRAGRLESALEIMRKCVRLDPREAHYRENLVRFRQGPK